MVVVFFSLVVVSVDCYVGWCFDDMFKVEVVFDIGQVVGNGELVGVVVEVWFIVGGGQGCIGVECDGEGKVMVVRFVVWYNWVCRYGKIFFLVFN